MKIADLRPAFRQLLDAKRAQHPELRRPLTYLGLLVVAKREHIDVLPLKLPTWSHSRAFSFHGSTCVMLNQALSPADVIEPLVAAIASIWLGLPSSPEPRARTGAVATWHTVQRQVRGNRKPNVVAAALIAEAGVRPIGSRGDVRVELRARPLRRAGIAASRAQS